MERLQKPETEFEMNGLDVYKDTAISTQNSGKLIVMLYDGAIKFLKQAIIHMEDKDYLAKGKCISRAQDIIDELNTVLDMDSGGEVAQSLRSLYNFMVRHLSDANIKCDPSKCQDVIGLLEDLNESWRAITS
jgi:flagellar protein FliS